MKSTVKTIVALLLLLGLGTLGLAVNRKIEERKAGLGKVAGPRKELAVPVEVAPVERGTIENRRVFSGTLAAHAQFIVAPKVAGRIERVAVDLGDVVRRGQTVVELDSEEFDHAEARAEADLAVAKARVLEVQAGVDQALRELDRVTELKKKNIATQVELDAAEADLTARRAGLEVARAQVRRAEADRATARTRSDYTKVVASWDGGSEERRVAERFVDTGETVTANAPLLSIVELDPIKATIFVTEADYGRLETDMKVTLAADALPGRRFPARIERISPIFRRESRQARVELVVDNEGLLLRPGMFVRAEIVIERLADATVVPLDALVKRDGQAGVFVVGDDGRAHWRTLQPGIQEGDRLQVVGAELTGRVVTLGQQLLEDGSPLAIHGDRPGAGAAEK